MAFACRCSPELVGWWYRSLSRLLQGISPEALSRDVSLIWLRKETAILLWAQAAVAVHTCEKKSDLV